MSPIYNLLFPSSRSDVESIETIASNGRRRYKSAFVNSRRKNAEWVLIILVNRYGEAGWGAVRETLRKNPSVWSLAHRGRAVETIAPLLLLSEDSSSWLRSKRGARLRGILTRDPRRSPDFFNDHNWGKLGDP